MVQPEKQHCRSAALLNFLPLSRGSFFCLLRAQVSSESFLCSFVTGGLRLYLGKIWVALCLNLSFLLIDVTVTLCSGNPPSLSPTATYRQLLPWAWAATLALPVLYMWLPVPPAVGVRPVRMHPHICIMTTCARPHQKSTVQTKAQVDSRTRIQILCVLSSDQETSRTSQRGHSLREIAAGNCTQLPAQEKRTRREA